jgi:Domain of unknown function (DUF4407)
MLNKSPNPNLDSLSYFLACILAGGDPELLSNPALKNDLARYKIVGLLLLFTGMFATGSGTFAALTFFRLGNTSLLAGSVWGGLILTLDCLIMRQSTCEVVDDSKLEQKKGQGLAKKIAIVAIRLGFTAGIGLFMSIPPVLQLFEPKITEYLEAEQDNKFPMEVSKIDAKISAKKDELERQKTEAQARIDKSELEVKTAKSEWERGYKDGGQSVGPLAMKADLEYKRILKQDEKIKGDDQTIIVDSNSKLELLAKEKEDDIKKLKASQKASMASLPGQLEGLEKLAESKEGASIKSMRLNVEILIILVEIIPQLMKMLGGKGVYEIALENHKKKQLKIMDRTLEQKEKEQTEQYYTNERARAEKIRARNKN